MNRPDAASGAPTSGAASDAVLGRVVRQEAAFIVASLSRAFRSIDVAEEAVAAAVEEALREWRVRGVPPNPGGWLIAAARHNALDRMRRERRYAEKLALLERQPEAPAPSEADERLALLFGCCHPALAPAAQLALTLRAVVGLTTEQIARATLEPAATVAQRIVRAKRKIAASGIPLRVPQGADRAARLDLVLTVISVMYDTAHLVRGGEATADRDVADDAIWLAQVVTRALPREAEAHGLLALLLFHRSRENARAVDGDLVPLPRQDRSRWDRGQIALAQSALRRGADLHRPGRWQYNAAIAACHSDAEYARATDWPQILVLYDLLLTCDRSPIVRLNRVVALAEVAGPDVALAELDALAVRLERSHLWHAVRGEMLRRAGRIPESRAAEQTAHDLAVNKAERRLLSERLAATIQPSE